MRLDPPDRPDDFEDFCRDFFAEVWGYPETQKHGRSGQNQAGVDVFGQDEGVWVGVQCKQKDLSLGRWLTVKELEEEAAKARDFSPPLGRLILATTGPRDTNLQQRARELTEENKKAGRFSVSVLAWEDLWRELEGRQSLLTRLFPRYWRPLYDALMARARPDRISPTQLRHTAPKLFGREAEFADLYRAWQDPAIHVVTFVAFGGVGKTSLVAAWAAELASRGYDGARYFDWSFYSQGSSDQSNATGELFANAALRFFGDEEMAASNKSGWDKGARLAQLVAQEKTLLILDGLEPLQYGEKDPLEGELKDPAVLTLLKRLAQGHPGLCVVTTRIRVKELEAFHQTTAPERVLEKLSTDAGVALLESLEVHGPRQDMAALVQEVQGHALTLQLVGSYLHRAHRGDVRRRDLIDFQKADARTLKGHAFRAMAAYESWLAQGGEEGLRQLAVLRLLGLFDRPADPGCLAALRKPPAIPHLTDLLIPLDDEDWTFTLTTLADHHLLSLRLPEREGDRGGEGLDAHPLLREYFAHQLKTNHPEAWREGHRRLYEHLTSTTDHQPSTLAGLQPLYQAVAHGCQAGLIREARADVYRDRILRGTGHDGFYSTRQLGAIGADLGAVSQFFEKPWSQVSTALTAGDQAWVLNEAAYFLRALGRLREALEPMEAGLEPDVARQHWIGAAISASNLSELQLTLGDLAAAQASGADAVTYADRSEDAFQRRGKRATHADALHQAGHPEPAHELFQKAESLQAEDQPEYPRLYSVWGFRFCDLLLTEAERAAWGVVASAGVEATENQISATAILLDACRDASHRAEANLGFYPKHVALLDLALDHLTLARAALYRAILTGTPPPPYPASEIDQAVDGLRNAGQQVMLPLGLLTRSLLHHLNGHPDLARVDLDEAHEIASRGPMPLFLADVALHRARLFRDRDALAEARRLITDHGYGRRLAELVMAEGALLREPLP